MWINLNHDNNRILSGKQPQTCRPTPQKLTPVELTILNITCNTEFVYFWVNHKIYLICTLYLQFHQDLNHHSSPDSDSSLSDQATFLFVCVLDVRPLFCWIFSGHFPWKENYTVSSKYIGRFPWTINEEFISNNYSYISLTVFQCHISFNVNIKYQFIVFQDFTHTNTLFYGFATFQKYFDVFF